MPTPSEQKQRASPLKNPVRASTNKPLTIVSTLVSECLCNGTYHMKKGWAPSTQFVELQGIRFIGLGAVADELTPRERVYDTLEVFRTRTERLVSVGYLIDKEKIGVEAAEGKEQQQKTEKATETVPLDAWTRDFPDEHLSRDVKKMIALVRQKEFGALVEELAKQLQWQKSHPNRGNSRYFAGITAHNLGVAKVLAGSDKEAEPLFREAITLKEEAFGDDHTEVALSWDELGIQLFARSDFEGASLAFRKAHTLRKESGNQDNEGGGTAAEEVPNPILAMTLNNIACCEFQLGRHSAALETLEEARNIQHRAVGSAVQDDLDLLHVAIVYCNCGYLKLALKQYEAARSILEEGLLIQQSVLDDNNHRAVRDTLSNLEFANAFHS